MGTRRRKYDKEFKTEAVRLAMRGDRKVIEVARDLGVHPNLIYNWKERLEEDGAYSFPGSGKLKVPDEQLRRLQWELADIKEERDILKKALAIFSRTPR